MKFVSAFLFRFQLVKDYYFLKGEMVWRMLFQRNEGNLDLNISFLVLGRSSATFHTQFVHTFPQ